MNTTKNPIIKKRILTMTEEIYDKCVIPANKASSQELTAAEKKSIDRMVVKYLETAKYVVTSFRNAVRTLKENNNN